jgi:hypothetical protein
MARSNLTQSTSSLFEIQKLIADSAQRARAEIEMLRERIAAVQADLDVAKLAPVTREEIAVRAGIMVEMWKADACQGSIFAEAGRPAGSYDENALSHAFNRLKPIELLAALQPDQLKTQLVEAALREASEAGLISMTTAQRATAIKKLSADLRQLEAEEELNLRQLADAGFALDRRKGVDRDIVDASTDQLQRMLS